MKNITIPIVLLAGALTGCATAPAPDSAAVKPQLTVSQWKACHAKAAKEISSRLFAQGMCGASTCYDDEGRTIEKLIVEQCGYAPATAIKVDPDNNSNAARSNVALLAPTDTRHARLAQLDRQDEAHRARLDAEYRYKIRNRGINITRVRIGMSEWDVRELMGPPDDINTTELKHTTHKQYVYGSSYYVYTENGVVTAIQR